MLILTVFIFHAISASLCFDLELEGVMRLGKDFLKSLNERSPPGSKLKLSLPLSFSSKGKLPKKVLGAPVMRANYDSNDTKILNIPQKHKKVDTNKEVHDKKGDRENRQDRENKWNQDTRVDQSKKYDQGERNRNNNADQKDKQDIKQAPDNKRKPTLLTTFHPKPTENKPDKSDLQTFIERLTKKGIRALSYTANRLQNELKSKKNITTMLTMLTDNYVNTMKTNYKYITGNRTDSDIDQDFVILDIVETSNRLLYSEERKLLNVIVTGLNSSSLNNSVSVMSERIYEQSVLDKKKDMRFVCYTYDVCRQYPAFSDYCADLISEILKLSSNKFKSFLELITKILLAKEKLFTTIIQKEDKVLITDKLKSISNDVFGMQELLAVVRAVITQRFKKIQSGDDKLKMRTKAMRIVIDIIDKALSMEEDLLAIDFDSTLKALRSWSGGLRKDIDSYLNDFGKHLFATLEHNLTKNARKELSVLIEIIMRGSTGQDEVYQRLFKYGSIYVKGEDFHTDWEIF